MREQVGSSTFDAWIGALDGSVEGDRLVVRCPDRFSRDWVQKRYGALIEAAAAAIGPVEYRIEVVPLRPDPVAARERVDPDSAESPETAPRPAQTGLFEEFVAGPTNVLALEAARAVARGEAGQCSPLFLAAAPGLGKTLLCRAIADSLAREATVYRSAEDFTAEVTLAMRRDQMVRVRHRYRRSLNVLILENVQFLVGKRQTQIELFHTLDHLIQAGKTVVLTADRPPHEIEGLTPDLRGRMGTGLIASIAPPALDLRRAILRERASRGGVRLPEDCLEVLAARPVDNVRDLVSGLNQVVARASLLRTRITRALVDEALGSLAVVARRWTLEEIQYRIARTYNLTVEDLRGRSRRRQVGRPRHLAMYLCRRYTDASFSDIGRAFNRDHTSVMYAVEQVERRIVENPTLRYEVETVVKRVN